jgi:peptidoglycan hydrolase-like protein with peptidoglycan-binding domain
MHHIFRTTAAAALLVTLAAGHAHAADPKGNYIVRGIGARPCSDYIKAVGASADQVRPYLSWMEGYLTGINRLQAKTFDVSPVTSAALVGHMVRNFCSTQPELRFETAVAQLMNFFDDYKVPDQSQLVEVTVGDANAAIRQSTLKWMQAQMKAAGFFVGEPDGLYGNSTKTALVAYQKANKIPETGVPDSATLVHFVQKDTEAKAKKP